MATNDVRMSVVRAAESQLGFSNPEPYWLACSVQRPFPPAWCGAFALWSLKRAGLACGWEWRIGLGFLWRLSLTHEPQMGDIAYFAKHQHHAVVVNRIFTFPDYFTRGSTLLDVEQDEKADPVELRATMVDLVNGNGADGKVSASRCDVGDVTAFYSINRLLTPSEAPGSV
jgi:hypothetical protein